MKMILNPKCNNKVQVMQIKKKRKIKSLQLKTQIVKINNNKLIKVIPIKIVLKCI